MDDYKKVVGNLLHISSQIKVYHWQTLSFARHKATDELYAEFNSLMDRFVEAMMHIRAEISEIESGKITLEDSALRNSPHTAEDIAGEWDRKYSRETAVFPVSGLRTGKYWPPVNRIDGAYGDRNLICSCPSPREMANS